MDHISAAHAHVAPMAEVQTPPTTLSTISPDLAGLCLFFLLGLILSGAILSCVSFEMTRMMFFKGVTYVAV